MFHVISPAKTLDFTTPSATDVCTQPQFLKDSQALIKQLRHLSPADLSRLMGISDALGELNAQRFHEWTLPFTAINAKAAIFAFKGDVYTGMAAEEFTAADVTQAQARLRILSGLYGLLRPLDLIQPYRLEMGTRLATSRGKNLYEFWGERITDALNTELEAAGQSTLVNLASNEYWGAVNPKRLRAQVITPVFKDRKNGQYKIISFFAKKARGMMSAYLIRHRLSDPGALQAFDLAGYRFNAGLSRAREWVFTRDEPL